MLVEGPYAAKYFSDNTPYDIWTHEYMSSIGYELSQMQRHSGHKHMSRILEYIGNIEGPGSPPSIIMQPYMGILRNKMFISQGGDNDEWVNVARQICLGKNYKNVFFFFLLFGNFWLV